MAQPSLAYCSGHLHLKVNHDTKIKQQSRVGVFYEMARAEFTVERICLKFDFICVVNTLCRNKCEKKKFSDFLSFLQPTFY